MALQVQSKQLVRNKLGVNRLLSQTLLFHSQFCSQFRIKKLGKLLKLGLFLTTSFLSFNSYSLDQPRELRIYNWSDYIAPETIADFEKKTGIHVIYDTYSSNEDLEFVLMTESKQYDLVFPSSNFLQKQLISNLYQPLDKTKLPDFNTVFDPELIRVIAKGDPENKYGLPYLWNSTGIGYNVDKIRSILGADARIDSWALLFDKSNAEKLKECGIAWVDSPAEVFSLALTYLGVDPNTKDTEAYYQVTKLFDELSPTIRYINSSDYIDDLANGNICIALGWSGDMYQAAEQARADGKGINIDYIIPKEGSMATFDLAAIPRNAKNVTEVYEFLNYLMNPDVIARISNYVFYANLNIKSEPFLDTELIHNPNIYPPKEIREKMYVTDIASPIIERTIKRSWLDAFPQIKHD